MAIKDQRTRPPLDSIPKPPKATRPCLSLIDLTPNTYIDTIVRVIRIKAKEKEDERARGKRSYVFGIAEDSTFRTPFMCYKPYRSFFHYSVFKFQNAYVHRFEDNSFLLILTEEPA